MKPEEAIKSLQNIIEYWTYKPTEVEAAKLAIAALEKQIPKKPLVVNGRKLCPICGYDNWLDAYCTRCGQALYWDNE